MIKILKKNKKAQLFTILSLMLLGLMLLSFELFSYLNERNVITTRVSTMNSFVNSIEENLDKQIYIAGYRIMFLAGNYIIDEGVYLGKDSYYTNSDPINQFFEEAFLNGSVANQEEPILFTYDTLLEELQGKAKKMNLIIEFENPPSSIDVVQDDPWSFKLVVTFDMKVRDREGLAEWNKTQVISPAIPVTGFRDPVYNVETYNRVERLVQKTSFELWDAENLEDHIEMKLYYNNSEAPSYLNRLVGNFSEDVNGIESFVFRPDLVTQGIPSPEKSCVDYIYFSSENPSYSSVAGVYPSWFRIDSEHKDIYCPGCS